MAIGEVVYDVDLGRGARLGRAVILDRASDFLSCDLRSGQRGIVVGIGRRLDDHSQMEIVVSMGLRAAQRVSHVDPVLLFLNLGIAIREFWMRKIRGAAHHRNDQTMILDLLTELWPFRFICHFQKTRIPLQSFNIELRGEFNPFGDFHRAVFAEGLHEGFGEGGELGHGEL